MMGVLLLGVVALEPVALGVLDVEDTSGDDDLLLDFLLLLLSS